VDALPGNHDSAPATDTPLHPHGFGRRYWWWAGGAGIADAGCFGRGERVGQAAQENTVVDELEQAVVETDGDASAGEVVADRVLPAGETDQAGGVDGAVDLDRITRLADRDGRWTGGTAVVGEQPL
jgi:hypothetical protein